MQKKLTQETKLLIFLNILFVLVAAYILQARLFEIPSIRVSHYAAGACNFALVILYPLAVMLCLFYLKKWTDAEMENKRRGRWFIALAILPFLVVISVTMGLQKWAPEYEEAAYLSIVDAFENDTTLTKDEVLEILGAPLSQENVREQEVWSYTYMPSTGIGWNKRLLYFDETGNMVGYYRFSELGPE